MIDTLTSTNHQDFQQRYGGTFGFFIHPDKKEKMLVQVVNAGRDAVSFRDIAGNDYKANADAKVEFEFIPVTRGFFNTKKEGVVFLQRIPARQWHRGICMENTKLSSCKTYPFKTITNFFNTLNSVFLEDALPKQEWFNYFENNNQIAITRNFALLNGDVFFLDNVIGTYEKDTIKLTSSLVIQELRDSLQRNGFPMQVIYE